MNELKTRVENLASRLAEIKSGRITPNDLLPYLPISLELAEEHLREMADGSVVIATERDGFVTFEFPEFLKSGSEPLDRDGSQNGSAAVLGGASPSLDAQTDRKLRTELLKLAESNAWPAMAVKEHEILFITSSVRGPITVAAVTGKSRLTLRRLKDELQRLARAKYARAVIDDSHGVLTYVFPPIEYDRMAYERHDDFIRSHPASLKDEVENKAIHSLVGVAAIALVCLILAFFHIPFRYLLLGGLMASAFTAFVIFTKKNPVRPDQI